MVYDVISNGMLKSKMQRICGNVLIGLKTEANLLTQKVRVFFLFGPFLLKYNMDQLTEASKKFIAGYKKDTPASLKLIDVYLVYILITGIVQFVYMALVGTFPYNAFLGGFISTVGSFVLACNIS